MKALTEAVGLSREQETLHRKHRTAGRELEQLFHSLEQRCESLQNLTRRLETELSGLTAAISSHERRAANLQDVVASSSTGLSDMAALLEGQERRTFDLSQAWVSRHFGKILFDSTCSPNLGCCFGFERLKRLTASDSKWPATSRRRGAPFGSWLRQALSTARKELLELGHLEAKSFSDRREKSPAETRAKDTQDKRGRREEGEKKWEEKEEREEKERESQLPLRRRMQFGRRCETFRTCSKV